MPEVKHAAAEFKAIEGDKGVVEMFVAIMGNVDLGGDKMVPGAFDTTLKAWEKSGNPIPFIWSHEWDNPMAHIGVVEEAAERDIDGKTGLWVKARIDLDKPFASQVFDLLKERRVTQASFAYAVNKSAIVDAGEGETTPRYDGKVRELHEVDLFEVGPTLLGMNPATDLLEAASLLKVGRTISGKNEDALKQARELIDGVLKAVEAQPEDEESPDGEKAVGDSERIVSAEQVAALLARTMYEGS